MNTSRFIVGLILIAVAVAMILLGGETVFTAGAVPLGILGIVSIAISRKKKTA